MGTTSIGNRMAPMLAVSLLIGGSGELHAQTKSIEVPSTATVPGIDADLSERVWSEAAVISLDYEWFPGDNVAPQVTTECRLIASAASLYVGCDARDPTPAEIRGHHVNRDEASGDDAIAILLDPAGSSRRGYQFEVTALGVQSDALFGEESGTDESWDATWASAGRITEGGYAVEMAIPFRALRRQSGSEVQSWGIVITRIRPRSASARMGSMALDRDDNCLLCQAIRLEGLSAVKAGRGARLQPTFTATGEEEDGEPFNSVVHIGVSGRWSPAPATRVSLTVNPDFSQVEADAAEFEINRRFALSFPEKRPFFLDDSDFFDVSEDLLFTRTVVDPITGAKLTAQRGDHSLGAMATLDRVNSRILPGNRDSERVSTDGSVLGLVGRYRLDLPNSSSIGLLATGRFASDYHNTVLALDGTFRLGRSQRVRLLIAGSDTDDEEEIDQITGNSAGFRGVRWNARYDLDARDWEIEAGFRGFSSGFRSDAGLVQRVDLLGPEFQVARIIRPDNRTWFDQIEFAVEGQRLMDFRWNVIDEKFEVAGSYDGPMQSSVTLSHAWRRQAFDLELFSVQATEVEMDLRLSDAVSLGVSAEFGSEIDSDNSRLADFLQLGAESRLLLGRSLRLGLGQRWQRLSIPAGRIFRASLTSLRMEYHFGLRLFVRTILQYRDIHRDPALWVDQVDSYSNRLFLQLLVSYEATPQTVIFAGYAGTASDFSGLGLDPQERSLFLKLGYELQF